MLPELGHFALILALLLAGLQAFFGLAAPALHRDRWLAAVVPATAGHAVMVATAFACLVASFVRFDFSVLYVAQNSNSALPLVYRIAAVWGAHEGSLLLWIVLLACWTVAAAFGVARLPPRFAARVLGVLGLVSFGFLLFTLATSNPFLRLVPAAPDGRDLNPLLQDPGLAMHPPLLYAGYVGFAVAFAFAVAAMLEGRLDQAWAKWTRPWTLAAWAFLSLGIALGSATISVVAIYNKLNGIGLVEGTRVTISRAEGSVLGDPNDLSLILLFPLGFAVSMLAHNTGRLNRLFSLVAAGLIIWAIVCTQSRGGLLGILTVCGIVGFRMVKSKALLITVAAVAALGLFAAMGISKRASGGAAEEGIDESAMGRIYAWGAAWKMAKTRPLNGVGLDNFVANYYLYSDHWDGQNHAVHSTWFNVLSETGFPGFFTFIYMIFVIGFSAYRSMIRLAQARAPPIVQAMSLALVAGIVGFCVGGTFLTQGFTWPVYILIALTTATGHYVRENFPEEPRRARY